jgi:6-phosphogluconolactonase (cycloisomerase 2 family)
MGIDVAVNKGLIPSVPHGRMTWVACLASWLSACSGGIGAVSTSGTGAVTQYTVGGTVAGLTGSGLVLDDNGSDDVAVSAAGAFTFTIPLVPGDSYSITVRNQPTSPSQTCTVSNGSGIVTGANISLSVSCVNKTSNTDVIGGIVEGLSGSGLVLQNNFGDNLAVSADGGFAFATQLMTGAAYSVSILSPPINPYQNCVVANGGGIVGANDVLNVVITCKSNPNPAFPISGTVSGLSAGSAIILLDNGRDNLTVNANGAFKFTIPIPSGSGYSVTSSGATGQQSQTCTIDNASGTVAGAAVANIKVKCLSNLSVTATVSGLPTGSTVVLRNNGGDDLAVTQNGLVAFQTAVATGSTYRVTIFSEPPGYACAVAGGVGVVTATGVSGVAVACSSIGGLLYVTNGGGNDVSGFAIDYATGALQPLTQVVAAAGQANAIVAATGINPTSIIAGCSLGAPTFSPTLYIASPGSGTIAGYAADTTFGATGAGALTATTVPPVAAGTRPSFLDFIQLSPICELYALNTGSANISEFAADGAGALTPATGSPLAEPVNSVPAGAANASVFNNSTLLTFEYVANQVTNTVSAYSVNPDGTLNPTNDLTTGTNTIAAGTKPSAIATDVLFETINQVNLDVPYVYVANQTDATISAYQADPFSGALTALGSPVATGNGPTAMVEAAGFLYVANGLDNTISVYSIATSAPATPGTLTLIGTVATGTNPAALTAATVNVTTYLYAVNTTSNDVYVYSVDFSTGALTFIAKYAVGSAPTAIAVPYSVSGG